MQNKRVVISGAPGAGKTSLIEGLQARGYETFQEYSRTLIEEGKKQGKSNFFLSDPQEFSERIFLGRKAQFEAAHTLEKDVKNALVFYDRGIHDIQAYLEAIHQSNSSWENRVRLFQYDFVFLVEPWEAIYQKDKQRLESFQQAEMYFPFIERIFEKNHTVVLIPKMSIEDRIEFVEDYL
ncbi:MAG: ATP-binding protein [Flavobacteriaceae bacterium]